MYENHTTKNGETILIASMGDRHLWNTISMICDQITLQKVILTGQYMSDSDPFVQVMMPQTSAESQRQSARERIRFLVKKLEPYVMESTLRDFDGVPELLQETFGRDKKISARSQSIKPLLLDGAEE